MNVFLGRNFVCYLDNSNWTEENGTTHMRNIDIGYAHILEHEEYHRSKEWLKEYLYGETEVHSWRSDEGTLA